MSHNYDVIVVGAGAVGSAAAYHAAKAGQRVLLIERFEIDHQNGSSYGASRIIRYAYDNADCARLMKAVYPAWRVFEEAAGERLYTQTGGLDFGFPDEPTMVETVRSMETNAIPFELLSRQDAESRFPQFRFDDGMQIIYQADSGVLEASKSVRAHVRMAQQHGATVLENAPVTAIDVQADSVTVTTPQGQYSAAKLILVPGGWGSEVFRMAGLHIPLTVRKAQEQYFDALPPTDFEPERFPVFIAHLQESYGWMPYGLPSMASSGLKVGMHGGPLVDDVNTMDRTPDPAATTNARAFMQKFIPAGADAPLRYARSCLYTMTPDEHFILDTHPQHPHVVISASCSGHAFKFSTLLGSILTDLALDGSTPHDISFFRMARFEEAGVV
jgi:sarcosine oxidase